MVKSDKQFEKVLKVLTDADGSAVTKEYLLKELGGEIVANRISTYLWEIRSKANINVESVFEQAIRIGATAYTGDGVDWGGLIAEGVQFGLTQAMCCVVSGVR